MRARLSAGEVQRRTSRGNLVFGGLDRLAQLAKIVGREWRAPSDGFVLLDDLPPLTVWSGPRPTCRPDGICPVLASSSEEDARPCANFIARR